MTARITTQKLGGSRISLPPAGFGALMVATLVVGSLIGAAGYAVIGDAIAQPATVSVTLARESTVVRDLRIAAARGQLVGETEATAISATVPRESTVVRDLRLAAARGQLVGESNVVTLASETTTTVITHATGRGPLR